MIRRPPRSTRTDTLFPTRRSSELLDRPRAIRADRLRQRDALFAHRLAHLVGDERRRRFLDDLLVAALDAALAFVEVEDIAVLVAEDLNLDVARVEDEFLDKDAVVAEAAQPDRKSTRLNSSH